MTAKLTALPACTVFLLAATLLLAAGATPAAAGGTWRVQGKSEGLFHRLPEGSDWQPSPSGQELPPGTSLQARDGTAMVGQADNRIIILSGGELTLPPLETETVVQRHGRIRYKIRPGSTHDFGVQTPYLAIGIKGTTFDVAVRSAGAEVQVLEGRVAVSTPDDRYRADLTPGQTARIGAAPGSVLEVRQPSGKVSDQASGQASGQAPGQASGQGFAPAPQHQSDAPAAQPDAEDTESPAMAPAGYQHEPSLASPGPVATVIGATTGILGQLTTGIRDLLSNVEVIADERLRFAPRTVVKTARGLSLLGLRNRNSRDSGGGSGGETPGGGGTGGSGSDSSGATGGSAGGGSSGSGGSAGAGSGGSTASGGSASGGSSGGSSSGGGLGGGLGGAVGGLGGAVGGAVGGVGSAVGGAVGGVGSAVGGAVGGVGRGVGGAVGGVGRGVGGAVGGVGRGVGGAVGGLGRGVGSAVGGLGRGLGGALGGGRGGRRK
jgi:hypothetical protein